MVELSDFKFVNNVTIENGLPDYVIGFVAGGCEHYEPPPEYKITYCYYDYLGSMLVGSSVYSNLSRIRLEKKSLTNIQIFATVGVTLVTILGGLYAWNTYNKKK
jgi:hypothetical protein